MKRKGEGGEWGVEGEQKKRRCGKTGDKGRNEDEVGRGRGRAMLI